jgi:purine catabolism regulator
LTAVTWEVSKGVDRESELHHRLASRHIQHLLFQDTLRCTAAVADDPTTLLALREEVGEEVPIGVSLTIEDLSGFAVAGRQSRYALKVASVAGLPALRYGEPAEGLMLMPRTLSESELVIDQVLGTLIEHDKENRLQLVATLRAFLVLNRSWKQTAESLAMHQQTLLYRIRKVEELTGRRLNRTADVAILWQALELHSILELGG